MAHFEPRSSSVLSVSRFADVDEFKSALRNVHVQIWPAHAGPIAAMHAVLPLPDGEAYLFHSFPRIIDVAVPANRLVVGLPLNDISTEPIVNGQLMSANSLVLGRGPGSYHMIERADGFGATLLLSSTLQDRGWPASGRMLVSFTCTAPAFAELQRVVKRAFAVASYFPSQLASPAARLGLQEQLLVALDRAFAQVRRSDLVRALSFQTSLTIVDRIEEILAQDLSQPIYSNELAARLHVSVRTMNTAMSKIRGMSLHRYLRVRRLWAVRRQLLAGDETIQVKDSALANGFWHLSEFSSQYVARFGEHPSETLARAIARRR
jgi:AraC-like DNA-binding protein